MFIGREKELEALNELLKKNTSSFGVITGRRRIGKSRLIEEFGKKFPKFYEFSGLPPTKKTTAQTERNEFLNQFKRNFNVPGIAADDWSNLFWHLGNNTKTGRVLILLDEISWMGSRDPDFLGKLKNAWDLYFKKNAHLVLVVCGSASSWIEENILSSTGFLGRISLKLVLRELPLADCNKFWGRAKNRISAYEKFKFLAITGGIPRYLEEMKPELSSEENIKRLCFKESGILFNEFEQIFSDLFTKRAQKFKKIVQQLANRNAELSDFYRILKIKKGGTVTKYLDNLIKAGFITRDFSWQLKEGIQSKLSRYRLSDNYIRFYLKYIEPLRSKIIQGNFEFQSLSFLNGWETILGYQFENLILNNRNYIHKKLMINPNEIISDNPFFQRKTATADGCQIDYMIQTKFNTVYVCETKFNRNPLPPTIINEVTKKIEKLVTPKNFSIRPVLIHVSGVCDQIVESGFFDRIICFSDLIESSE